MPAWKCGCARTGQLTATRATRATRLIPTARGSPPVRRTCTRLYLDASRAKNRHWCGMGTCGNRAKVQAFRARQRASSSTA